MRARGFFALGAAPQRLFEPRVAGPDYHRGARAAHRWQVLERASRLDAQAGARQDPGARGAGHGAARLRTAADAAAHRHWNRIRLLHQRRVGQQGRPHVLELRVATLHLSSVATDRIGGCVHF
eukprot:6191657-Pleurochrysis_carterae.AAC.3